MACEVDALNPTIVGGHEKTGVRLSELPPFLVAKPDYDSKQCHKTRSDVDLNNNFATIP
jgi:hypothetical protein